MKKINLFPQAAEKPAEEAPPAEEPTNKKAEEEVSAPVTSNDQPMEAPQVSAGANEVQNEVNVS